MMIPSLLFQIRGTLAEGRTTLEKVGWASEIINTHRQKYLLGQAITERTAVWLRWFFLARLINYAITNRINGSRDPFPHSEIDRSASHERGVIKPEFSQRQN